MVPIMLPTKLQGVALNSFHQLNLKVADLEGAEPAPPLPFGRKTDAVTRGHVS